MVRTGAYLSSSASDSLSSGADGPDISDRAEDVEEEGGTTTGSKSGSSSHVQEASQPTEDLQEKIAGKETRAVWRSKLSVIFVLVLVALIVASLTYRFVKEQEESEFVSLFNGYAQEVADASSSNARNTFTAISSFSTSLTSDAVHRNVQWPNMTVPHFEIRGRDVHKLAGSLLVTLAPIVTAATRIGWEEYAIANQGWIQEGLNYATELYGQPPVPPVTDIPPRIYNFVRGGMAAVTHAGPYAPLWQQSPAPANSNVVNLDLLVSPVIRRTFDFMRVQNRPVLSEVVDLRSLYQNLISSGQNADDPHSFLLQPVYDYFGNSGQIVAILMAVIPWTNYFSYMVNDDVGDMYLVLNSCGRAFTYVIQGRVASFVGEGDLHNTEMNRYKITTSFSTDASDNYRPLCAYDMDLYPSPLLYEESKSNKALLYALAVSSCFVITTIVFLLYDAMVKRRQKKVMATAIRTNKIVASLFPSTFRDRIMQGVEAEINGELEGKRSGTMAPTSKARLRTFLHGDRTDTENDGAAGNGSAASKRRSKSVFGSEPIADLFTETTVLFADIVGFTAWSSTREPEQVFTLLETVYHAFDVLAARRKVFKVETVGDCYVAVTGLPDPQPDHAVIMAKFANECKNKVIDVLHELEISLGPDTVDLGMRFGLHSGPVTAGVLRGERARFQLFGDTMNTASRIETSGKKNKIHLSKDTADLLIAAGKASWVVPREDKVLAKGKGVLESYWLDVNKGDSRSTASRSSASDCNGDLHDPERDSRLPLASRANLSSDKLHRLICWNVDILASLLKNVVARRLAKQSAGSKKPEPNIYKNQENQLICSGCPLDEFKEIVELPQCDLEVIKREPNPEEIELDDTVLRQLNDYVTAIASAYRENPFHNFEHASHVTMSVKKLLSRIVRPEEVNEIMDLHDHTYGITADPLTQFTVVLSALIHDVDHQGVPNAVLVNEDSPLASLYKGKSVLEQNSVDISWRLLMNSEYEKLLACICATEEELRHFRQLVVNTVMATDIMDRDLGQLRKKRWENAFSEESRDLCDSATRNRRATIIIEHLIQASDVSHTMQHWHVYTKWNELFFYEMYLAYNCGRLAKDPSENWYESEIGFFDFYVIPLAKKLNTCGVFGVSYYEYLGYAQKNRNEWESKGKELVEEYLVRYRERYGHLSSSKMYYQT